MVLGAACARIVPPAGGPEDRTAPRVVAVVPDSGATGVSRDEPVRLTFSERMNRSSVRDWLEITPWPGRLVCVWEEQTLVCRAEEGWRPGTTYAVLLGTRASDPRRNALERPLLFAFSTGDSLDSGKVSGQVLTRSLPAEGVPVFLFAWPEDVAEPIDSTVSLGLDPLRALRIGESGKEGRFDLLFVPQHRRLLLAGLYDRDGDRSYDAEMDLWGFAPRPVVVGDSTRAAGPIDLYLVYADEPGDLAGTVTDSACAGYVPPARLRAAADSLEKILSGRVDAMGFPAVPNDSLPGATLSPAETESVRVNAEDLGTRLTAALTESLRCAAPIWVSAVRPDSTTAGEVRGTGTFQLTGLAPGFYRLSAFRDLSGDGVPQTDEPAGVFPQAVELLPGRRVTGIDWEIILAPRGSR